MLVRTYLRIAFSQKFMVFLLRLILIYGSAVAGHFLKSTFVAVESALPTHARGPDVLPRRLVSEGADLPAC